MGAVYLGILAIQMGITFFEEYLERPFLILLTDASKYYFDFYNYHTDFYFRCLIVDIRVKWKKFR